MKEIKPYNNAEKKAKSEAFHRLLNIMVELREKCPWDRKQTMETLRHLTIEETYELSQAISNSDIEEIKKELGDLMLHIVFYSLIAEEQKYFSIKDVLNSICDKLIRRHPHIYGDVVANDIKTVKENWEKIKLKEKKGNHTILGGVPNDLPAMIKAIRIQEKVSSVGFDWKEQKEVWEKVKEELSEFELEYNALDFANHDSKNRMESEFGDLLFSLINFSRFIGVNPENALENANKKFMGRFQYLERNIEKEGKNLSEMTLLEMNMYWEKAKMKD